jgi:hypothetical protein
MNWYKKKIIAQGNPLLDAIQLLKSKMALEAQEVYDEWSQDNDGIDEHYGGGGICDDISNALANVLINIPDVEVQDGGWDGDDHAWLIVSLGKEKYGVDIPHNIYETGGGYKI